MNIAIYLHWPFCISKCPYCSFNSYVSPVPDLFIEKYLEKLEIYAKTLKDRKLTSIYFGGGTPSLMKVYDIERILNKINSLCGVKEDTEITIEINPGTVTKQNLIEYKNIGINRASVGIQSLNDTNLKFLGRIHSVKENRTVISWVQELFTNYNFDFIYGLPDQNIKEWEHELTQIAELESPHLSLYQLTIEDNTPFCAMGYKIDNDTSYAFYTAARDTLVNHSYNHYEISNFAKAGYESSHNLSYWNYEDFIGVGAGACGRITNNNIKYEIKDTEDINKWMESGIKLTQLTPMESEEEALLMGLRTVYGVKIDRIKNIYKNNNKKINEYIKDGFLYERQDSLIATEEGMVKLNAILEDLVDI